MIYSHFFLYSILGHQLLFKRQHCVVPIHGHVYRKLGRRSLGKWIIESKVYLLCMLGREKKVQDCDYVFGSSTKFKRRMNGFVIADICRQESVCLRVFCGILFALKLFRDYSLCSVCILPQPAFYSQSVVFHFTLSQQFTPGPQLACVAGGIV